MRVLAWFKACAVTAGDEILVQIMLAESRDTGNPTHVVKRIDAPFGTVTEGDPGLTLIGRMLWGVFGTEPTPLRGRRLISVLSQESSRWVAEDFE